jgi:hypothetical protein
MKRWSTSSSVILVDKYKHWIFAGWALLVIAYVRFKAPIIWQAEWSHDDLMNCYRAMEASWQQLAFDTLCFWKPTNLYRPLGEIFYKVLWEQFGFSPLPWRLACGAILIGNAFLLGHLASRLSGSFSVGLAAMAVASFHSLWAHLYLNTGTIYEILAYSFVWGGLAYYVEFHDPYFTAVLLIVGLNAKESVIVLPVFVVLYEWIWRRRTPWVFCGLAGAICLGFIFGRVFGKDGLASIGLYQPSYSADAYFKSFRGYFGPLVLWKQAPPLLALLPLLLRSRYALFATLVFPIAILPLAFVPDRGLDGVYVACAGLALSLSAVLLLIPKESWRLGGAALVFLGLFVFLPPMRHHDGWDREFHEIRNFRTSLQQLVPSAPPKAQIRFESEPFTDEYPWASTFITRLVYKDTSILPVSKLNAHTRNLDPKDDFAVLEWKVDRLYRIK